MENGHVTVVASLRDEEWSCYGGCHFNGRENDITQMEMVTLMEGEWRMENGERYRWSL